MKKLAICAVWLILSACSGIVKHSEDTFWPLGNPNAPKGESENMRRVRGDNVVSRPILAEEGDIWPGQPDPVPTLRDVSNPDSHFNETFHRSLKTLDRELVKQPFDDGESLSIGEEVSIENGVKRKSSAIGAPLPSRVKDNAPAYLQGPNHDTVAIPNGDGTTSMVAPDGTVTIVRGNPDSPEKAKAARSEAETSKADTANNTDRKSQVESDVPDLAMPSFATNETTGQELKDVHNDSEKKHTLK